MIVVVSTHDVADFERWKRAFDHGMAEVQQPGLVAHRLYRAVDDADEILVEFEFDELEHAKAFMARADEVWLERAGLDVYPPVFVGAPIEVVEHGG